MARGFTAILTCLDARNPLPTHMAWLEPDAPDPPIPPPQRRSKILERKRRSTVAQRSMNARNLQRLEMLRAAALAAEEGKGEEGAGAGAGAGAGGGFLDGDDVSTVYDSADSDMDTGDAGDDAEFSSDDELENRRVFVKPAHKIIQARDVDTVRGWAELLPHVSGLRCPPCCCCCCCCRCCASVSAMVAHSPPLWLLLQVPEACRFIHEQLRVSPPPFATDDDPALSAKPGGRVLIQCSTGNQQGVIVAMAYMIVKMGFAPWKALNVCAFARAQVCRASRWRAHIRPPPLSHICLAVCLACV